jgi:hypothetical protein
MCVVLLPASIFMLCPTSAHPDDADLVDELIREVELSTSDQGDRPIDQLQGATQDVVQTWLSRRASALSPYFVNRFGSRRGVLHVSDLPPSSQPLEPPSWRTLTIRQACMIVGALHEAVPAQELMCA